MKKVKMNTKLLTDQLTNYKMLVKAMGESGLNKKLEMDKIIKNKIPENFELLSFMKSYYEEKRNSTRITVDETEFTTKAEDKLEEKVLEELTKKDFVSSPAKTILKSDEMLQSPEKVIVKLPEKQPEKIQEIIFDKTPEKAVEENRTTTSNGILNTDSISKEDVKNEILNTKTSEKRDIKVLNGQKGPSTKNNTTTFNKSVSNVSTNTSSIAKKSVFGNHNENTNSNIIKKKSTMIVDDNQNETSVLNSGQEINLSEKINEKPPKSEQG